MSEDGRDVDVTLFPSWLEGTTSKPVEKSWDGLFCSCFPVGTLLARRYWKEGRNGREEDGGGEGVQWAKGKMVRAACWKLCDAKDLCCSAPLCEGWERETMTGRALGWLTRSMRALPMSLLTGIVTSGERWWLHSEQMQARSDLQ